MRLIDSYAEIHPMGLLAQAITTYRLPTSGFKDVFERITTQSIKNPKRAVSEEFWKEIEYDISAKIKEFLKDKPFVLRLFPLEEVIPPLVSQCQTVWKTQYDLVESDRYQTLISEGVPGLNPITTRAEELGKRVVYLDQDNQAHLDSLSLVHSPQKWIQKNALREEEWASRISKQDVDYCLLRAGTAHLQTGGNLDAILRSRYNIQIHLVGN